MPDCINGFELLQTERVIFMSMQKRSGRVTFHGGNALPNEKSQISNTAGLRRAVRECVVLGLVAAASAFQVAAQSKTATAIYLDKTQPIHARVDDLMRRMTLKEKVGQLNLPCAYVDALGKTIPEKMDAARKFAAGTYTNEIGPGAGFFTLADTIKLNDLPRQVNYFNELQKIAMTQTRLKFPYFRMKREPTARCSREPPFSLKASPSAAPLICPWCKPSMRLRHRRRRSTGIHVLSTLVLETDRDPRLGRNMEGYTEDPYLDSRIATNIVEGAQGSNIDAPDKVVALDDRFSDAERARQRVGARCNRTLRALYSREFSATLDCGLQRGRVGRDGRLSGD